MQLTEQDKIYQRVIISHFDGFLERKYDESVKCLIDTSIYTDDCKSILFKVELEKFHIHWYRVYLRGNNFRIKFIQEDIED